MTLSPPAEPSASPARREPGRLPLPVWFALPFLVYALAFVFPLSLGLLPLGGAFLCLLLIPADHRLAVACLAGAVFINVSRMFVDSQYALLAFDLLLYGTVLTALANRWTAGGAILPRGEGNAPLLLALLFLGITLAQMFNANIPSLQFGLHGLRKTSFTLVGFFAAVTLFSQEKHLEKAWRWIGVAGLPVFLYGIKQAFFFSSVDYRLLELSKADLYTMQLAGFRSFSILPGPFHLGMFGCMGAVIALHFLRPGRRWFWLLVFLSAFASIVAAQTRTNLATLLLVSFLYLVLTSQRRGVWLKGLAVVGILVSLLLILVFVVKVERFERLVTSFAQIDRDKRLLDRWSTYLVAWEGIADRPWLGHGTGSAGDTMEADLGVNLYTSHNLALKILLETGIPGFLAFAGFLTACLLPYRTLWRNRRNHPDRHRLAALALCIVLVVLINGCFGSAIEAYPVNLFFWFALGSLVVLGRLAEAPEAP